MKNLYILLVALVMAVFLYGKAEAVPFTFEMGSNSSIDTSGTQGALTMYAIMNPNLGSQSFTLNDSESHTFLFATLGTTESWVNNDDLHPGNLEASVHFDNPQLAHAIGGTSVGFKSIISFTQGWNVAWEGPETISLTDNGQFSIALSDVSYSNWFWQGPEGSADIFATVTLNAVAVPEPAVMLLLGIGMFTLAGFVRRRNSIKK